MANKYDISIVNGQGTEEVLKGSYSVTGNFPGYDATTLTPTTVTIGDETTYAFTISATGALTVHVSDGAGTDIVGATLTLTDENGVAIGEVQTTDASGNVTFANVPYGTETGVPAVYFKQLTSDGAHEFSEEVQSTTLTTQAETYEVTNTPAETKTFTVADANYTSIPVDGTLTIDNTI